MINKMPFRRYDSLTNAYAINPIIIKQNQTVVASEKIDGANFAVYVDKNNNVKFAKRTDFIEVDEDLFNWKTQWFADSNKETRDSLSLWKSVNYPDSEVIVYGEYYGSNVRTSYGTEGDFVFFDGYEVESNKLRRFEWLELEASRARLSDFSAS